ncbi:MAG: ABC transporter permease [Vagococcus sp.]
MKFREFVFKNTIRNKNLYLAYFLSTLTTVMTFFTFAVFAFHPQLASGLHAAVQIGMLTSSVIIYLFSFFYVLYSMDIFLQSRKKEFGLLLIQGMSPKQLKKMVFQENMIIGFFATIFGTTIGIFFAQFILWLSHITMHVNLGFYFPIKAIIVTVVSFTLLFLLISFFIQFKIPKMDVQELLKSGELGKGIVQVSLIKSIVGLMLIGLGYTISLSVHGMTVVMVMFPVIVIVIVGTKLLFNQLSVFFVNRLQRNQRLFWKKTNMLVFSDLGFRMKDNARSFFLVSVITTVAFSAIGTLIGFRELSLEGTDSFPYDFYYQPSDDSKKNESAMLTKMNLEIDTHKLETNQATLHVLDVKDDKTNDLYKIIKVSDYNRIAKEIKNIQIAINDNEAMRLDVKDRSSNSPKLDIPKTIHTKENGVELNVHDFMISKHIVSTFDDVFVVSDENYPNFLSGTKESVFYGWFVTNGTFTDQVNVGKSMSEHRDVQSRAYMVQMITDMYAPVLFVGFFISVIFFISAGSFLYFRLYSDMDLDKEKFRMVYKLGFSKKEMKKVVYQQVGILFFTPIIVSSLHGIVALKAMYALFDEGMHATAFIVLGTFVGIQLVYYVIARVFYFNKLYQSVISTD